MQLNLEALALFMLEEVDCSSEYEDDCFAVSFQGERLFCNRYPSHFAIEIVSTAQIVELPRP